MLVFYLVDTKTIDQKLFKIIGKDGDFYFHYNDLKFSSVFYKITN